MASALAMTAGIVVSATPTTQAATLTGFVKDKAGAPVIGGDLDFDRAFDNLRIFTPGDNTDINGFYSVTVAPNIYHVSFAPPLKSHLVGKKFFNLDLRVGIILPVVLDSGVVITGTVTDSTGLPFLGVVNIDVDSLGGGRVYTPAGKTDSLTGKYWVVVPRYDKYRLRFKPPVGVNLQLGQIDSISIQSDTVINFSLISGIAISGTVTETNGSPAPLTQLSLKRIIDGVKLPLTNNKSDSLGDYSIIAPAGAYTLQFAPPRGQPLVAVAFDSVTISADTVVNVTLTSGIIVNATIIDIDGIPLQNADMDVTRESDLVRLFTPHDKTDSNGLAVLILPPDIYEFKADPPLGQLLDKSVIRNINISIDTALSFTLNNLSRITVTGRIVDMQGNGLPNIEIAARTYPEQIPLTVKRQFSDSLGFFNSAVPIGSIDVLIAPPRGSRYFGKPLTNLTLIADSSLGTIALEQGIIVNAHILNQIGDPETDYKLRFNNSQSNAEQYLPHDTTNIFGQALVTIPSGQYSVTALPQIGLGGDTLILDSIAFNNDTSLTLVIGASSSADSETLILRQNFPNPFNSATRMPYLLNKAANVTLAIYNVLGQTVRNYDFGLQDPGYYTPTWDGADTNGSPVASGVYFYRLQTETSETTRTMLFIR